MMKFRKEINRGYARLTHGDSNQSQGSAAKDCTLGLNMRVRNRRYY
jgi:hypothetical protein